MVREMQKDEGKRYTIHFSVKKKDPAAFSRTQV
jgi:hypothetical protein